MFCYGENPNDALPSQDLEPALDASSKLQPPKDHQVHFNGNEHFVYAGILIYEIPELVQKCNIIKLYCFDFRNFVLHIYFWYDRAAESCYCYTQ